MYMNCYSKRVHKYDFYGADFFRFIMSVLPYPVTVLYYSFCENFPVGYLDMILSALLLASIYYTQIKSSAFFSLENGAIIIVPLSFMPIINSNRQ